MPQSKSVEWIERRTVTNRWGPACQYASFFEVLLSVVDTRFAVTAIKLFSTCTEEDLPCRSMNASLSRSGRGVLLPLSPRNPQARTTEGERRKGRCVSLKDHIFALTCVEWPRLLLPKRGALGTVLI